MKKPLVLFVVMTMCAVACSDDASEDSALSNALADAILADSSGGDIETTEDEARCVADAMIDTLGEDRLDELGVTVESVENGMDPDLEELDLSDEESQSYIDAASDCIDLEGFLVAILIDYGNGMSEEDAKCIAETADSDFYSRFRASLHPRGSPPDESHLVDDVGTIVYDTASECLDGGGPAVDMLMEAGYREEHAKCVVENLEYGYFVWMVTSLHPEENSPEFTEAFNDMRSECDKFGYDDSGGDSALSDAIADAILADASGGDIEPTADEAQCMANAVIDTLGEDRLDELGVTAETVEEGMDLQDADLSDEEFESYSEAALDCLDVEALVTQSLIDDGASEDDAKCVAEKLDPELMSSFATQDPTSNPDLMNEMLDVMAECDVTDFG